MLLSLIVPCYNEAEVLPLFIKECKETLRKLKEQYGLEEEVIFINDGSKDDTLKLLKQFHEENEMFKYISFSRNFGKEAGIYAGLQHAKGDLVALLDADLQDPPELLIQMVSDMQSGQYDCVATYRVDRKGEPVIRSFFARQFYKIQNRMSDAKMKEGARDYRLMSRKMVDAILEITEYNRFSKGIFVWVGFETKWIPYENVNRQIGKSKWNFFSLLHYAIDGLVGYTTVPLEICALLGIVFFLLSIIGILFIIIRKLIFGDPVAGWASTVVIILFCAGVQLSCTGIIGEYLAKTYQEVKHRPLYIISETSETK